MDSKYEVNETKIGADESTAASTHVYWDAIIALFLQHKNAILRFLQMNWDLNADGAFLLDVTNSQWNL